MVLWWWDFRKTCYWSLWICTQLITTQLWSFLLTDFFPKLDYDIKEGLNAGINVEEVCQAIFSMAPLKRQFIQWVTLVVERGGLKLRLISRKLMKGFNGIFLTILYLMSVSQNIGKNDYDVCVISIHATLMEWLFFVTSIPTRGLRQGDPLAQYLFIWGMKCLGHLIDFVVEQKFWERVMLSQSGPRVSHLFFVDDLVLFYRANV